MSRFVGVPTVAAPLPRFNAIKHCELCCIPDVILDQMPLTFAWWRRREIFSSCHQVLFAAAPCLTRIPYLCTAPSLSCRPSSCAGNAILIYLAPMPKIIVI